MKEIFLEFQDIPFRKTRLEINDGSIKFSELPFNKNRIHAINTMGEFKSLILQYFNDEQNEFGYNNPNNIEFQVKNNVIVRKDTELLINCFRHHGTYIITNHNVYDRLHNEPKFRGIISYALFEYYEFDRTRYNESKTSGMQVINPSGKTSKVISFVVIAKLKNKYVSISLNNPTSIDFSRGSTITTYCRLNYDHTLDIYDDGPDVFEKVTKKTCNLHSLTSDEKWCSEIECSVCLEIKQCIINDPCNHTTYCRECFDKLDKKICSVCTKKYTHVMKQKMLKTLFLSDYF